LLVRSSQKKSANLATSALSSRCGNGRITLSSGGYISGSATDYVIYTWWSACCIYPLRNQVFWTLTIQLDGWDKTAGFLTHFTPTPTICGPSWST